jgi:hypothetical protein
VKIFPTIFAKVLVRAGRFIHDANAPAMLPDFANVALDKQTTEIVIQCVWVRQTRRGFASIGWWAWVLLVATHTTGDFIFLCDIVFELVIELGGLVFVVVVLARSSAG